MKKLLPLAFYLAFAFVFIVNPFLVQAQEEIAEDTEAIETAPDQGMSPAGKALIYPPRPPGGASNLFGQNQWYSVILRGNGEAVITVKVALSNTNENGAALSSTKLRLPSRIIPSDINVYQIIAQGYCQRYEDLKPGVEIVYRTPNCIEYSEPDYFSYYGGGKYQKAKFEYSGDTITVNLPTPIKAEKSGAFFVYLRAMGYAKKNIIGAYKYNFESFKSEDSINQLNIGISTDSDLYLKGSKGQVDYRYAESAVALKSADAAGAPMASPAIDRVISQIGYGTISKNAANLAPLESYKVSGVYANSRIKLLGREIAISIVVLAVVSLIIILVIRKVLRMMNTPLTVATPTTKKTSMPVQAENPNPENARLILSSLAISFIASLVLTGFTIVIVLISQNLNYIDYQLASIVRLAGGIFAFCVYAVLLFIPGIYFGYKKGTGWGILTVVLTVGWLFVYFAVFTAIVLVFGFQQSYPTIMGGATMMEGVKR